ncbi:conjugal transfer protein TrbG/VirB9/CagX [Pseudomonas sp. BAY1663]|nr:conjugal transfer protein TrbG/VirB9/CagX [Pseudomonas sp. BAY1663]
MNLPFRFYAFVLMFAALSGCASQGKPPPTISLDEPVQAQPLPEPPKPVEVVAVPEPLALPAQLKPLPDVDEAAPVPEPADEKVRVSRANAEARIAPTREATSTRFRCGRIATAHCIRSMRHRGASPWFRSSLARNW